MKKLFALSLISILCMPLHAQTVDYKENTVTSSGYSFFLSIDGVLYAGTDISTDGDHPNYAPKILVRYPSEKTNTTFEIPETVEYIAPHAFKGNKYLKTIIFPSCFGITYNGRTEYLKISTSAFDDTAIEEFITKGAATSISSARVNKKGNDKKYNLQGMEINSPQKGEVYIQDGKKYVDK